MEKYCLYVLLQLIGLDSPVGTASTTRAHVALSGEYLITHVESCVTEVKNEKSIMNTVFCFSVLFVVETE